VLLCGLDSSGLVHGSVKDFFENCYDVI